MSIIMLNAIVIATQHYTQVRHQVCCIGASGSSSFPPRVMTSLGQATFCPCVCGGGGAVSCLAITIAAFCVV